MLLNANNLPMAVIRAGMRAQPTGFSASVPRFSDIEMYWAELTGPDMAYKPPDSVFFIELLKSVLNFDVYVIQPGL